MAQTYLVEQADSKKFESCPCCGRSSNRVWGSVATVDRVVAAYFVHWTLGHVPENGANFDLIVGAWDDNTSERDRSAVSLEYRLLDSGPTFRIIDADGRDTAKSDLVGRALSRSEVIGTPLADEIFAICDAVLAQDDRIAEILGSWSVQEDG